MNWLATGQLFSLCAMRCIRMPVLCFIKHHMSITYIHTYMNIQNRECHPTEVKYCKCILCYVVYK